MKITGFNYQKIKIGDVNINYAIGGNGPALLLIHGYPETHLMWHEIAPKLAENFTVICPDLRGYGDSDKPAGLPDHSNYSKRTMAQDLVSLMTVLGYNFFSLVGHDRGARVVHRLCLDHQARVKKAVVMDIVPTYQIYMTAGREIATDYYHWFFLIQPSPLPERLIGNDPEFYFNWTLRGWGSKGSDFYNPDVLAEYQRCSNYPEAIHAMCEDYRAGASIDLVHDEADLSQKITCPLLVLWGKNGVIEKNYNVLESWQDRAEQVSAEAIDAGHFLVEEKPKASLIALESFLYN